MVWNVCLKSLEQELPSDQFNTWIRPLQVEPSPDRVKILAPNRFVKDWVTDRYLARIKELVNDQGDMRVVLEVGSVARASSPSEDSPKPATTVSALQKRTAESGVGQNKPSRVQVEGSVKHTSRLNPNHTFDNFVEGKSNQLARAAAQRVAENPGAEYNPLFLYGDTGLGKTHLMHAVGNQIQARNPDAKIIYVHSERFVADMVKALQLNAINDFKRVYRNVDALLIDDIQFFAGKDKSQEEFFHTFNTLLEGGQQIILTSDRYPKEIDRMEDRLKSRFGWGLTVRLESPELETRVAILINKASEAGCELERDCAFFIAQKVRGNVRDLEGALKRVIANSKFLNQSITVEFIAETLKDMIALHDRQVSLDNIQRVVADFFKLKVSDLLSARRNRSIARPRQIAMALAKELTSHSLPEIGEAFGGRDHTTVLHACRKVKELLNTDTVIKADYDKLFKSLAG